MGEFIKTPLSTDNDDSGKIPLTKKMVKYLKNNSAVFIVSIVFLTILTYQNIDTRVELAKKDIQIETASKQSEIEEIFTLADQSKKASLLTMDKINKKYEEVKELEATYEKQVLTSKCYQSQMQRKADGLDYSISFCKESQNLEQFKTVK